MEQPPTSDELTASAIDAIEKGDRFAAVELLNQQDPQLAAEVYGKLQSDFYWNRKDVPLMVAISQAGIQHGLTAAVRVGDAEFARALRGSAKALAFNLASFTWPGWDEKGISLDRSDLAAGMDAAKLNLRLAEELDRPDEAKANACWVLGAHRLTVLDFDGAEEAFLWAGALAAKARAAVLSKAMDVYALMAKAFAEPDHAETRRKFDLALAALRCDERKGAEFFAEQLEVAFRVFQAVVVARN
jgi:hypothetical protein